MPSQPSLDLIGVGAPIMDIVAAVPESFLSLTRGEKGGMVMVEAEEIAQLVAQLPAPPVLTPGGSAANTTFNATRLGLRTAFVGKLGGDELARLYRTRFANAGVSLDRFKQSDQPNARCLILTTPDAQRTMRTCLGAVMTLSPDEIRVEDFAGCRHAHIEGYVVFNRALADAIFRAARAAGCTLSLDLASFEVVRGARDWLFAQLDAGLDLVFANEDEIRALFPDAPHDDYGTLARRLASHGLHRRGKTRQRRRLDRPRHRTRPHPSPSHHRCDRQQRRRRRLGRRISFRLFAGLPARPVRRCRRNSRRRNRAPHGPDHPRRPLASHRRAGKSAAGQKLTDKTAQPRRIRTSSDESGHRNWK